MKYSPTTAKQIGSKVVYEKYSIRSVSSLYGVDKMEVLLWSNLLRKWGKEVFERPRDFSNQEKIAIIEDKITNGLSIVQTCVKYGILYRCRFRYWFRHYKYYKRMSQRTPGRKKTDKSGSVKTVCGDQSRRIMELEEELLRLKAENAFLKKLRALMQEAQGNGKF